MKEKALLLDCGGVMVYPRTGDWAISPEMLRVLGDDFLHTKLERFREAKRTCAELIPDGHRLEDETAEAAMLECFYRRALSQMGETLTDAQYAFLVQCQLRHDRYGYFDDVLPHLRRWRGAVKLAIVSDAPPSPRRILRDAGISACVDVQTFSFQLGALKPDARMYLRALEQLRIAPQDAVFVDDLAGNLRGAQAVGIRAIQMCRSMPAQFRTDPPWEGEIAHDFAQLGRLLGLPQV